MLVLYENLISQLELIKHCIILVIFVKIFQVRSVERKLFWQLSFLFKNAMIVMHYFLTVTMKITITSLNVIPIMARSF